MEISKDNDRTLLIGLMRNSIENKHALAEVEKFEDKELAKTYNEFFQKFINGNNKNALDLNAAMDIIGNVESVKKMLETVHYQKTEVTEVDSSLNELSDSMNVTSAAIDKIFSYVESAYKNSLKSVEDVNESMNFVDNSFNRIMVINGQISEMRDHLEKIYGIASSVKSVARQINILAINASIEAARAGAAGKGFAVVAEEVRRLAGLTGKSAEDIDAKVESLQGDIKNIVATVQTTTSDLNKSKDLVGATVTEITEISDNMQHINTQTNEVFDVNKKQNLLISNFIDKVKIISNHANDLYTYCNETGSDLYKISRAVDSVRGNVARQQANLSTKQWLSVYRTDHIIFTWRLYNMVEGFETLDLKKINNHKTCKLGLWYFSVTDTKLRNNRDFIDIDKHHERLHRLAADCVTACNQKKYEAGMNKFNEAVTVLDKLNECISRVESLM